MQGEAGISLSGLALGSGAWGATARTALEWACGLGYAWVQIDAAMPGLRPRELVSAAGSPWSSSAVARLFRCTAVSTATCPETCSSKANAWR